MIRTLLLFSVALVGCGGEANDRPPPARPSPATTSSSSPLPLPDTAFRTDETGTNGSRFETRRIGEGSAAGERGRYRGAPVDLDLKNTELAEVFRLLADVGKVNIVVAGDVTGTITMRLKNVPWDQAVDLVARLKHLDVEREGNVILVRHATERTSPSP